MEHALNKRTHGLKLGCGIDDRLAKRKLKDLCVRSDHRAAARGTRLSRTPGELRLGVSAQPRVQGRAYTGQLR
jgi:hypothetical protein